MGVLYSYEDLLVLWKSFLSRSEFSFPFAFYFLLFTLSLSFILNRFNALKINPLWKGVLKFGQAELAIK